MTVEEKNAESEREEMSPVWNGASEGVREGLAKEFLSLKVSCRIHG